MSRYQAVDRSYGIVCFRQGCIERPTRFLQAVLLSVEVGIAFEADG